MAKKAVEFSYDKTLVRIQEISEALQANEVSFEESMALFQEGSALIAQCQQFLDDSELIIQKVIEKNGTFTETDI